MKTIHLLVIASVVISTIGAIYFATSFLAGASFLKDRFKTPTSYEEGLRHRIWKQIKIGFITYTVFIIIDTVLFAYLITALIK